MVDPNIQKLGAGIIPPKEKGFPDLRSRLGLKTELTCEAREKGGHAGQENRRLVEAKAVLIGREIKKGTFDYLKWFPEGNRAEQFRPKEEPPKTVGEYYQAWILRKTPPVVDQGSRGIIGTISESTYCQSSKIQRLRTSRLPYLKPSEAIYCKNT